MGLCVGAGEACDEVIFTSSDGAFSGIAPMAVWWCKLEVDVLFAHEILECLRGFVVESL